MPAKKKEEEAPATPPEVAPADVKTPVKDVTDSFKKVSLGSAGGAKFSPSRAANVFFGRRKRGFLCL
eukprot:g20558.t1